MEEKPAEDLLEVSKDPVLLAEVKEDIKKLDVLVCGECHAVCHFVEEFQTHKDSCPKESLLKNTCDNDDKPQVWGFVLWKHKQLKAEDREEPPPTAWKIYQRWCELPQDQKDPWILAGKTIQLFSKIDDDGKGNNGDIKNGTPDTNRAIRNVKDGETEEFAVEKIVGKRFNPRRKTWEYSIKWENMDEDKNTWEALANLSQCSAMVEAFDEEVKKQKALKAKSLNPGTPKGRGRPKLTQSTPKSTVGILSTDSTGRPQRTSKQKALNQVKAWCGNISDTDDGGIKRPFDDDDDSDDSFEKKMKLEEDSEDSDGGRPPTILKKNTKTNFHILNNGMGKKFPQNILVPDANGVVRINQKQLPSLSTGVYIMSKTAGIIKLDSATSKAATSGGQTIVKLAPKIGQTQIKIVKKDGVNKIFHMSPKPGMATKTYKPVVTKVKKAEGNDKAAASKLVVKKELSPIFSDLDSDDGIEEMEFPTDPIVPEPESPPTEFTLDPSTGKIAGQDYPETTEPEPEAMNPEPLSAESTLENIVKLAAADITEEDLKPEQNLPQEEIEASQLMGDIKTEAQSPATNDDMELEMKPEVSILNKALTNSNILQKSLLNRPKVQQRVLNQSVATRAAPVSPLIRTISKNTNIIRTKPQAPKPKYNITSTKFQDQGVRNVFSKTSNVRTGPTAVYKNMQSGTKPQTRIISQNNAGMNVYKNVQNKESLIQGESSKTKTVINMPSLIGDDEPGSSGLPTIVASASDDSADSSIVTSGGNEEVGSFSYTGEESPLFITGDDGTIYQVAGENEQGQTILITEGSDGQQQCLLVTNEAAQEESSTPTEVEPVITPEVQDPLSIKTDSDDSNQVVAQVVRAEPPSPGGTHKVVVMLPDGNLMVTAVSPEEYASLELE